MLKLPRVSCKYGAPMGRRGNASEPDALIKFHLQRLRWVDGDYDQGGAYWGHGVPVYWAQGDGAEEVQECFVRARSRAEAKALVRGIFPNARFYQ